MLFNSIEFLCFFPIVTFIYFILPSKVKYLWLLVSSYFFYFSWNSSYASIILLTTLVTFCGGLFMNSFDYLEIEENTINVLRKVILFGSIGTTLWLLYSYKYHDFVAGIVSKILLRFGIETNQRMNSFILVVGISFYTLQSIGYVIDVYRREVKPEMNPLKYALFISFFPQLVAGPIERYNNLAKQLTTNNKFNFERVRDGFLLMLWGFFLKIVIADRIAIFVNTVYGDYKHYGGYYLIVATVLFAIQIYCDFAGYSTISIGSAEVLGINLRRNFDSPYLALSVSDFWRRWHMSLTEWFKDYLYIPLGGNKNGRVRTFINKMLVFLMSGLWHGANLTFIVWGGLNAAYQIIGELSEPIKDALVKLLGLNRESIGHKLLRVLITFVLVDISWIFFRADTLSDAIEICRSIAIVQNPWILFDWSLYNCGLDVANFNLMIMCIGLLVLVDILNRKGIQIRKIIAEQDCWFRWIVIAVSIVAIITLGIWGPGYNESNFIYFQF